MPGWWFTIESTTARHFIKQFKTAIKDALRAEPAVCALMRARATKQRFPVQQWVEDLEKLQSSAIEISHKQAAKEKRPTLDTPSTPAILETPGLLNVLQSRLIKPSLRPRPAVARGLSSIAEGRPSRPKLTAAPSQIGDLSSVAEGRLLAGPSPGLGSKLGPSGRRKRQPPPILRSSTGPVASTAFVADNKQSNGDRISRPSMLRAPTAPNIRPRQNQNSQEATQTVERPTMKRSPSMPQLRPNDRKAVKILGMQLPSKEASALNASKHSPSSSDENSTPQPSDSSAPTTPGSASTGFYTPASTPRTSRPQSSVQTNTRPPSTVQTDTTTATSITTTSVKAPANTFNVIHTPNAVDMFPSLGGHYYPHGSVPILSTSEIQEEKPDNTLQNVTPFFSDPKKEYETIFQQKLKKLNGKNSENQLCIEEYLLKSEKSWFGKLRAAELSKPAEDKPPPEQAPTAMVQEIRKKARDDGFGLGNNYQPPSGLKRVMRLKIGDWPVYSFLLAFVSPPRPVEDRNLTLLTRVPQGQIIAANSYQITLLNGTIGESANKLYVIASIYLATSFGWWLLYRRLQTIYVVSLPFLFYGLAFFLIGISPVVPDSTNWLHNVATGLYALASSSGALYFAVNFADEGTRVSYLPYTCPSMLNVVLI